MTSRSVRVARAGLMRVCEPPSPMLAELVTHLGPEEAWDRVRSRKAGGPLDRATSARTRQLDPDALQVLAEEDLRLAQESGARLLIPEDDDWPVDAFATFPGRAETTAESLYPPLGLYVRGLGLPVSHREAVTVIGSRSSTGYGERVAADVSGGLAAAGLTVVSGAAYGIDGAAHRAALYQSAAAVTTVAVMACGIDRVYPQTNRRLIDAITESGTVLSEYAPGTTPARHRFLVRNRLIAALGTATVVIEAGRRSGTLNTAGTAERLSRLVMAVPGPITSAMSVGCHELIAGRGATLVTSAEDVLGLIGRGAGVGEDDWLLPLGPLDGLPTEVARVYEALPSRGAHTVAELEFESGIPSRKVMAALGVLEVRELARREGPRWRRVPLRQ